MDDRYRFLSTGVVWTAYATVLITLFIALVAGQPPVNETLMIMLGVFVLFLTSVAGMATATIWRAGGRRAAASPYVQQEAGKAKRDVSDRIGRLIEALDEDEIIELETLLAVRHDERR
ncbi:MAG: hypothetical protein HPY64_04000 [Anaerolineae bacterium]|nr:hypothetical protein [Anaerolineae bacterium]